MHFFQLTLCFWQNCMSAQFICKVWCSKPLFFYHTRCRFLYLPHAGVKPPTARKSQNQIKYLKLFHSYVPNSPDLKLTALQRADKNYRELEQRHQLLQNLISHSPVIAKKLSLENPGGIRATGFYTKLKFMCFMKKRTTSVAVKNPTFLHEEGELMQRHFLKPTITLNAAVAVYNTAVIQWLCEMTKLSKKKTPSQKATHQFCSADSVAWGNYKQQRHAIEIRIMSS